MTVGASLSLIVVMGVVLWSAIGVVSTREEYTHARSQARTDAGLLASAAVNGIRPSTVRDFLSQYANDVAEAGLSARSCDPIASFVGGTSDFGYLVLVDEAGGLVCTTFAAGSAQAITASQRAFGALTPIRQALQAGRVGGPLLATDPVNQRSAILDVIPIADPAGNGTAAAIVVYRYSSSLGIESATRGRADVEIVVVDAASRRIIGRSISDERSAGRPIDAALMAAAQDGAAHDDLDGVRRIYGMAEVNPPGWVILAGVEESAALVPARTAERRILVRSSLSVAVLIIMTVLVTRRIVRPIRNLVTTIDLHSGGDRSARAAASGPVELVQLAEEYNAMAEVRERSERELAERLSFIDAVASSLGEGVYATDTEGIVTFVNRAALELTGHRATDVIGHPAHDVLHPNRHQAVQWESVDCPMCSLLATETTVSDEHVLVRVDGGLVPVSFTASLICTGEDNVGVVYTFDDITERLEFEERLTHLALHDALTGLPNRTLFLDRLRSAIHRRSRATTQAVVLFIDLDRFKLANDTFGHDLGDQLLQEMAHRLSAALRPGDTISRFGGDEFTVLCEDINHPNEVLTIVDRLRAVISAPVSIAGRELVCTPSIGVAFVSGDSSPAEVLRDADAAMYRAKEQGPDRCEIFDDDMRTRMVRRLETENDLRIALAEGDQLALHYQPIVDATTGAVVGLEALARWHHPTRGLVSPADFISVAEETGLIVPLGAWVIEQACADARRRSDDDPANEALWISVNVSARQLAAAGLIDTIYNALRTYRITAQRLCLEITESVLVDDLDYVLESLLALRGLGVTLSIDDFGTGYSSLSYLGRFPVQKLKIDQTLVARATSSPRDRAVARSVISLAHALDLEVVAEGVERPEQLAMLRDDGCDLAQGYLFQRPVPADQVDGVTRAAVTVS